MPVLPPTAASPYDTVYKVLNTARVRLNDAILTTSAVSGKLLQNNQVFTQELVNAAWRKEQEFLANLGVSQFRQESIVYGLPAVASMDPSAQVRLDWFNFFDGANLFQAPVLPPDLMFPLEVWERQSGQNGAFCRMENMMAGLPDVQKGTRNGFWQWRADAIYMPGALNAIDLKIRYARYLADFTDNLPTPGLQWFQQLVPLMRSSDSLAYFICAEVGDARADMDGEAFRMKGEAAAKLIMNRDVARQQRTNVRRGSRSGRLEGIGSGDFSMVY